MQSVRTRQNWERVLNFLLFVLIFGVFAQFALAEDPDYGNDANTAYPIEPNGSFIVGDLNSTSDQDWFWFTAAADGLYEVTLHSPSGSKYIAVWGLNASDQLQQITSFYVNNTTVTNDVFISRAGSTWLKVYSGGSSGPYEISVNFVSAYPTDNYPNWCNSPPAPLVVNAPPLFDGITNQGMDEDWFTFPTVLLHKYQITLTHAYNTDIQFDLLNSGCGSSILTNKTSATMVSWDANNYNLRVHENGFNAEGYYEVSVTDLGLQQDDYGNTSASASSITPNGQLVDGSLQYSADWGSDEDWFKFTALADGLYEITLHSPSGRRDIAVYGLNDSNQSQQITSFYASSSTVTKDVFISRAGSTWLKVYSGTGPYEISVNLVTAYPTDNYPNWCSSPPASLEVNAPPLFDGITNQGMDEDWFAFPTGFLHKYQITLTPAYNTNIVFDLLNSDCGSSLLTNKTSATMVSWDANDYDLRVHENGFNAEGYYEVSVTDLGVQTDDYGNIPGSAFSITPNGQYVNGVIQYTADLGSDEDWFKFTAVADGNYAVTLYTPASNTITVYGLDDSGHLQQLVNFTVGHGWGADPRTENVLISRAGPSWLKVYGGSGSYQVAVLAPVPTCGDSSHPYPIGDFNKDCIVDFNDFATFAGSWLIDNRP